MQINVGTLLTLDNKRFLVKGIYRHKIARLAEHGNSTAMRTDLRNTPYFTYLVFNIEDFEQGDIITEDSEYLDLEVPGGAPTDWKRLYTRLIIKKGEHLDGPAGSEEGTAQAPSGQVEGAGERVEDRVGVGEAAAD